jgi:hypothetical protein
VSAKQNVYISVIGKDEVSKTLKNVQNGLDRLGGGAKAVGGALLKVGAVAATAAASVAAGFLTAAKAAAEEERGIAALNATIAANVKEKTDLAAVDERVTAQSKKLAFADDQVRSSLQALLPFTGNVNKAFEVQAVAADLARMKNMDLTTASLTVAKAMDGSKRALKELGIELEDGASKSEILGAIQEKVAGQADVYAKSFEGQMEILKNSLGDMVETVGGPFVGTLNTVVTWVNSELVPAVEEALPTIIEFGKGFLNAGTEIAKVAFDIAQGILPRLKEIAFFIRDEVVPRLRDFFGFLAENRGIIAFVAGTILALFAAFKIYTTYLAVVQTITAAYAAVQLAWNAIMAANPIGIVVIAIAALIAGLVAAYAASEDFRKIIDGVFEALQPVIKAVGDFLVAAFKVAVEYVKGFLNAMRPFFELIGKGLAILGDFVGFLWGDGKGPLPTAIGGIIGVFKVLGGIFEFVIKVLGTLFDIFMKVVKAIADSPIGFVIGAIGDFIGDIIGGFLARGGVASRNGAYVVGERGPELFVPNTAGRVIPNQRLDTFSRPAMSAPGGLSADSIRDALSGLVVVMDGERVGTLVDHRIAATIRGTRTSSRLGA